MSLSRDLLNSYKDSEGCDVKIRVGEEPNTKEFKVHSAILSARSIYFKSALSSKWAKKEDEFIIFNKPNISPLVFEVLINYFYSDELLIENNASLVDIFIAADEIESLEVCQQLEERLLKIESAWKFPKDFITICRHDNFANLYKVASTLVCKNPRIIFESKEFLTMEEDILIRLLERDDLRLEEFEIWEYLIKWGIENTDPSLDDDSTKWSPTDFKKLEETLYLCIPQIRFYQMTPKEFGAIKFKDILPGGLVIDVYNYFANPKSQRLFRVLPPREPAHPFDSSIINARDAALIASWIDNKQDEPYNFGSLPHEFKLIYRASNDGFNVDNFHRDCDNRGPTVVIIKVRGSGEIIGGYNPLDWRSFKSTELPLNIDFYNKHKCGTSKSFIFSLFSSTNGSIPVLSRVSSKKEAIIWCRDKGPCFGLQDLCVQNSSSGLRSSGKSRKHSYERKIINKENFEIEEYEVFQIIDKRFSFTKMVKGIFKFSARMVKGIYRFSTKVIGKTYDFFYNLNPAVYYTVSLILVALSVAALFTFGVYEFIGASILTKFFVVSSLFAITYMMCLRNT